jgi:hypothetical protein
MYEKQFSLFTNEMSPLVLDVVLSPEYRSTHSLCNATSS